MRIGVVLGTRPEVMKNYAIVKALRAHRAQFVVLHTHQHYDDKMSRCLFEEMGYAPDYVMPGRYQIGMAIDWVRRLIRTIGLGPGDRKRGHGRRRGGGFGSGVFGHRPGSCRGGPAVF